jgi:hypothetical protein
VGFWKYVSRRTFLRKKEKVKIVKQRIPWLDPATLGSLTAYWPIHYLETGNYHPYTNYVMQEMYEQLNFFVQHMAKKLLKTICRTCDDHVGSENTHCGRRNGPLTILHYLIRI